MLSDRLIKEFYTLIPDDSEHAHFRAVEAATARVQLRDVTRGDDPVVHHDRYAFAAGFRRPGHSNGRQEIDWSVGTDAGGRTLGADHDDGPVRIDGQVQKERGLLQPGSAVCH